MTVVLEVQDHAAHAVLICHPDPSMSSTAEFTYWADAAEARQAEAALGHPCSTRCQEVHSIVRIPSPLEPRRRTTTPRTRR